MIEIKPGDICENCNDHQASTVWIGDGGYLAATRSYMQHKWCKCCVLKEQIKHIESVSANLERYKKELEEACK